MDEVVQKLWTLSKADRIQNADYVIGIELQNLYSLMLSNKNLISAEENLEELLLSLISINKSQISITNSHLIALCAVIFYKRQTPPNYWKLLPFLTDEIKKLNRPSIYILGFLSKKLCDGFKSQLPTPIQFLLNVNSDEENLSPLICQCFRRIIKGTGTFLIQQIPDIFGYIFAGSSSTNENIRIEAVKSIPSLLENAHISIKKLLPMVGQLLSSPSKELRFAVAKSLAKLIFIQTENDTNSNSNNSTNNNPFRYCIKIVLQFSQNDRNVETLALAVSILMRFYQPIEIVKRLRTFARFALSLTSLGLPLPSLVFLANGIFASVVSVIGSTAGNSLCYHLLDSINADNMTASMAMTALTTLINFDASTKTVATAAKQFYPLLSSGRKDIQKVTIAFFAKLGLNESNLGRIFIDTFCAFLSTADDSRVNDIDGFSKAAAAVIVSAESIPDTSVEKVKKVIALYLNINKVKSNDNDYILGGEKIAMSFLLLAALAKKNNGYEYIPAAFNFIQSFLISLSKKKSHDPYLKKTIKFISLYLIMIISSPPKNFEKLISTIQGFVKILLPNIANLSKGGRRLFLKLAKMSSLLQLSSSSKEGDEKTADSIVRTIVRLFPLSSNIEEGVNIELDEILTADIGCALHNFKTPFIRASKIEYLSLIDIFFGKEKEDIYLKDLPYWVSKCSPIVLNEVIPPLFEFGKLGMTPIIAKLRILQTILMSKREFGLSKIFFEKLMRLETGVSSVFSDNSNGSSSSSQTLQHLLTLFALAQTVAQWIISNNNNNDNNNSNNKENNSEMLKILFNKNTMFTSFVIGFAAKKGSLPLSDEMQIQSFLFLSQKAQNINNSSLFFALTSFLPSFKFISDFLVQINDFLEKISFSDLLRKPSVLKEYSNCVLKLGNRINSVQLNHICRNLMNYPTNSTFSLLNGLNILSRTSNQALTLPNLTLQTPLPVLISAFSSRNATLEDAPLLFMMLQQSGSSLVTNYLLKLFEANKNNVKKWTDFSKRIVIIGCVPPAERKGDIRIVPTSFVLISAIKITVLLVSQIRMTMELSCVDDIVSIAFNAIHMDDRRIDFHCFQILSSVITCFSDVRNLEGSLLDVYFSQFHPTFCHAVDGKHELQSVASFVIEYFKYVKENRSLLVDEATSVLIQGLKAMRKYDSESLTFFCRIASLIPKENEEIDGLFQKAALVFLGDVLKQKRSLVELKDELPNFIAKIPENFEIPDRVILSLLLIELKSNCDSRNLTAVTNSRALDDEESIEFVLKIIANSSLIEAEEEENINENIENKQQNAFKKESKTFNENEIKSFDFGVSSESFESNESNELEENAFWIVPKKSTSSINNFLIKISEKVKMINLIEEILTLSLHKPICFGALCHLMKWNDIAKYAVKISETVITSISAKFNSAMQSNYDNVDEEKRNYDDHLALFKVLFDQLPLDSIDTILPVIVHELTYNSNNINNINNDNNYNKNGGFDAPLSIRFEILKYALKKLNGFKFASIEIITDFIQKNLLPDGLNFIGSLLVERETALSAVYILSNGLLNAIATATVSSPLGLRSLPRILHFFNLTADTLKKIVVVNIDDQQSFNILASRIVLVALAQASNVKERSAVVQPACSLIKKIDKEVLKAVFTSGRLQKQALSAVTPQKQAATIQLLTFANVSTRKAGTGWQSLDAGDSDDD